MVGEEALPCTQAVLFAHPERVMNWVLMGAGGDQCHSRTEDSVKIRMCPNKAIPTGRETVCLGQTDDHQRMHNPSLVP